MHTYIGVGGGLAALKKEVERVGSAYESAVAALAIRDEVGLATAMWTWLSSHACRGGFS
jgi:hypothetical protein